MRKKLFFLLLLVAGLVFTCACTESTAPTAAEPTAETKEAGETTEKETEEATHAFRQISPEEAKAIMDEDENAVILDVRTVEEFSEGHVPRAILIEDYAIREKAEEILTDKTATILVYCRSGRRSKLAAQALVEMGYTNVLEFGGIIDWPYETVTE